MNEHTTIQDAVMKYLAKLEDKMLNIYRTHEAGITLGQDEQLAENIWANIEDDITSRLGEIGEKS